MFRHQGQYSIWTDSNRMDLVCMTKCLSRTLAQKTDLCIFDQLSHCSNEFFNRVVRIYTMLEVQVTHIYIQGASS